LLDHGSRGEKIGKGGSNALVGTSHLTFKGVQLLVMKHLPPLAAHQVVPWLGGFPGKSRIL
jgi:hypothetical protein